MHPLQADPPPWHAQARCRFEGQPDWWHPPGVRLTYRRNAARALAICARCPVTRQCLEVALSRKSYHDHGIWGGTTPWDRDQIRKRLGQKVSKRSNE